MERFGKSTNGFKSNFELTNFIKGTEIAKLVEQLRSANSNISLRSINLGVVVKDSFLNL